MFDDNKEHNESSTEPSVAHTVGGNCSIDSPFNEISVKNEPRTATLLQENSVHKDISHRAEEITDAVASIDEQISNCLRSSDDTNFESNLERIAQLKLARKFLINILQESDTFRENPLELRVNQLRAVSKLISFLSDPALDRIQGYFGQPTGAGKTVLFGTIARLLNVKTLVLVPRYNLVNQTKDEFINVVGISPASIGTVTQGSNDTAPQFVIATYQSHVLKLRNDENYRKMVAECELIICDEAHRAIGDRTFESIEEAALGDRNTTVGIDSSDTQEESDKAQELVLDTIDTLNKSAAVFAFSATLELAGKSVKHYFKNCIASERYSDMVAAGICVPFLLHRVDGTVTEVDLEGTLTEEIETGLLKRENTYEKLASEYATAVRAYKGTQDSSQCPLRGVAFCVTITECDTFARVAAQHGLRCRVVTGREAKGRSGNEVVKEAERELVAGEIDLIVTVKKLAEGWDCKPVNAAIWARACNSAADVIQGIGRTGRAHYDEKFGKKGVSHIFETRWKLQTREGSRESARRNQPLGIADALLRNGEDPQLVCSNYDTSELELEKPYRASILDTFVLPFFEECRKKAEFEEVLWSISYLTSINIAETNENDLFSFIKKRVKDAWIIDSELERAIAARFSSASDKRLGGIFQELYELITQEILTKKMGHDLVSLVIYGKPREAEQAFSILSEQNPTYRDLCRIASTPCEHSTASWYLFKRQLPSAKYILQIMEQNPILRLRAWNELRRRDLVTKEIAYKITGETFSRRQYLSTPTILLEAQRCLLDKTTDNVDLTAIVANALSPELGAEAAQILFEQNPNVDQLWLILCNYKRWEQEILTELTSFKNPHLESIIHSYPNPWRLRAAELLSLGRPTDAELLTILQHVPEMETEVGERLMKHSLSSETLAEIVLSNEKFREKAAEIVFSRNSFSNGVRPRIHKIIETLPDVAPRAARALLDFDTSRGKISLMYIIKYVETYRKEALVRLRQYGKLTQEERSTIEKYSGTP